MKRLPHDMEQKLLAIMREYGKPFDETQACQDFAGALCRLNMLDQDGNRPGIRRPWGTLRILTWEAAQMFEEHTGEVLGRTTEGGRGARFIKELAGAAGKTDAKTRKPYTLQKCADTVQAMQKGLNEKAPLDRLPKFTKGNEGGVCNSEVEKMRDDPARDDARRALLKQHVVGYVDLEGNIVERPVFEATGEVFTSRDENANVTNFVVVDGPDPIFGGYEPAPNHDRLAALLREQAEKLIAESEGEPKKPKNKRG